MGLSMTSFVYVTLGNELRGDDGAGIMFGRELAEKCSGVPVIEAGTSPENILGKVANRHPETVILVDAIDFGGYPGEIRFYPADCLQTGDISTHAALGPVIDFLFTATGTTVVILGIQPGTVAFGTPMTPEVADGVRAAVKAAICHKRTMDRIRHLSENVS
jgi:hydrogenase 3 maturation protease